MKRSAHAIAAAFTFIGVVACGDAGLGDLPPVTRGDVPDATLFALSQPDASWTFYKRSAVPFKRSSQAHTESHALVRYNTFAASALDPEGKVRANASFPDSSIIVKELSNGTTITTLAIMMKLRGSASAGHGGWVWAEFGPTGAVKYPTKGRGAACSSCHASGIDFTRMNDSRP